MTYVKYDFGDAINPRFFVRESFAGVAEFTAESKADWVAAGLNYSGSPGGLGVWTCHASDLHPGFWTLRRPDLGLMGYASNGTFAQAIVDAMTDYPNAEPE